MKFCRACGAQIDENAIFCHQCGARVNGDTPHNPYGFNPYNPGGFYGISMKENPFIAIISFCLWQVGVIVWLVYRRTRPGFARSAIKGLTSAVCCQYPIAGLIIWLLLRNDPENRAYAKIAGISAIVGASLALVAVIIMLVVSASGNFVIPPEITEEFFGGVSAAFTHFSRF